MNHHSIQSFLSGVALTVLAMACGGSVPDSLSPQTILVNGKIVTVDADFSIAEAVAIRDGKFVAVGSDSEIQGLAGRETEVIDLDGKTVLPGFNDGHGHVTLNWGKKTDPIQARLGNASSIEEVLDLLREKMETLGPEELLWFDFGPSPSRLEENRFPNRFDLDKVSRDRPILLSLGSGSSAVVNTKLLRDLGITRGTPQPYEMGLFGEIVKDPGTGEPTGVFLGWAGQALIRRNLQLYPAQVQAENILRASEQIIKYGITTVGDPNSMVSSGNDNIPFIRAYQQLAAQGKLPVRVNCMPRIPLLTNPVEECLKYLDQFPYSPGFGNDFLVLRQLKIVVNSSSGKYKLSHDDVKTVVRAIHRAGWQMMIHVGRGGEAFDVALEALDEAYQDYPDGPQRHLITHARHPTEENLEILVRRGIMVDPQPGSLYNYADDAEETLLDPDRPAYGPLPLRTYLDRGVQLMISSDQQPVGPMFHIFEAVNRVRRSGKPIVPEESITVEEAIRATTLTPAYSTFQEDIKGSIEPGKLADLIVLGRDILTVPSMEIKDIPILRTMIGGEFVYINPNQDPNQEVRYWQPGRSRFVTMDVPAVEGLP
ncbi:MAG: amidohydrolase family protein [Acidobacteria bacterium]|nr:amidohydrolase family protein [Acidobacteriota bacterium]